MEVKKVLVILFHSTSVLFSKVNVLYKHVFFYFISRTILSNNLNPNPSFCEYIMLTHYIWFSVQSYFIHCIYFLQRGEKMIQCPITDLINGDESE